ncbi:hypothetical protein GCM10023165_43180 [Variovorax defluvii]|uniref:Uncharacterized protein n=1 Tax=Variovorax defluvii TaxID=913761 RepID=A0ABP8I7S8_9BURK
MKPVQNLPKTCFTASPAKRASATLKFKPIYEFSIDSEEDRANLKLIRDALAGMALPLSHDLALYHWSTTKETAQGIAEMGTAPGMREGRGSGICGRGFYVEVEEVEGMAPLPAGHASSHENPALLKITQRAHEMRVLNCNNRDLQTWFEETGLSGPSPQGADDIMNALAQIDNAWPEADGWPYLMVVMPWKYQCGQHDNDPRPADQCVIKHPIAGGVAGCSITLIENPVLPAKPDIPDLSSDDEGPTSPRDTDDETLSDEDTSASQIDDAEDQILSQGWNKV